MSMTLTRVLRFDALHVAPAHGSTTRHALSSPGFQRCGSPDSQVIRRAPTPRRPSRRASSPSLGDTTDASSCSSPTAPDAGPRIILELVSRDSGRHCRWRRRGLPSSRGTLLIIRPVLRPRRDRTGPVGPRVDLPDMAPAPDNNEGSPRRCFRGSIARLLIALSTLRRGSYPPATQDSLPAAGPALPDGIGYPQGSDERFRALGCPPLPSFLAQCQIIFQGETGGEIGVRAFRPSPMGTRPGNSPLSSSQRLIGSGPTSCITSG